MTEIIRAASAGTLESSDVYVDIEPCSQGIELQLESVVLAQFGGAIEAAVRDILLMGEQKNGEHREHDRNSYLSDESQGEPQTFRSLDDHTADYIRQVIKHTNGRISGKNGAAAILGLPPTTLWSKMRKLKISSR